MVGNGKGWSRDIGVSLGECGVASDWIALDWDGLGFSLVSSRDLICH